MLRQPCSQYCPDLDADGRGQSSICRRLSLSSRCHLAWRSVAKRLPPNLAFQHCRLPRIQGKSIKKNLRDCSSSMCPASRKSLAVGGWILFFVCGMGSHTTLVLILGSGDLHVRLAAFTRACVPDPSNLPTQHPRTCRSLMFCIQIGRHVQSEMQNLQLHPSQLPLSKLAGRAPILFGRMGHFRAATHSAPHLRRGHEKKRAVGIFGLSDFVPGAWGLHGFTFIFCLESRILVVRSHGINWSCSHATS